MTAIYSITYEDYRKASLIFVRHTGKMRRLQYLSVLWFFLPMGIILIAEAIILFRLPHGEPFFAGFALLLGLFFCSFAWQRRVNWRTLYRRQRIGGEVQFTIDEKGIAARRTDGNYEGTYQWAMVEKSFENPSTFVLLPDDVHMFILPKRALDSAQQTELRSLLERHAPTFRQVK